MDAREREKMQRRGGWAVFSCPYISIQKPSTPTEIAVLSAVVQRLRKRKRKRDEEKFEKNKNESSENYVSNHSTDPLPFFHDGPNTTIATLLYTSLPTRNSSDHSFIHSFFSGAPFCALFLLSPVSL